jgi:hypothetical protein
VVRSYVPPSSGNERPQGSRCMARDDSPAKLAIIREWDAWSQDHPGEAEIQDCMLFFSFLERERPDLLNFESGDKWQDVHAWLLRERRVKD